MLDLSSFEKALWSLDRAIKVVQRKATASDPDQAELNRAGVIQNFEFTYELAWKI